ncbi:hypothetical protein E2C01_036838 [Portunus trituberculatus]|uniref:Uncharacterized protein n=1 Tax=Portunus trituberculatus TaxID=210409 RepID=A0A5B7FDR5_PORTR|nr:hypothetical protein [Portunus trituberculatus]
MVSERITSFGSPPESSRARSFQADTQYSVESLANRGAVLFKENDVRVESKYSEGSLHHCLVVAGDTEGDVVSPGVVTLKLDDE